MTELERRALMGDKQAQEECTQEGILLPCHVCGEPAEMLETDTICISCSKNECNSLIIVMPSASVNDKLEAIS